jgi:putative MFS transporter
VGGAEQADTPGQRLGTDPDSATPPAWVRLAFFLGRPPALTSRQWRVLGLVGLASFFEMYDLYLFALTLKQIQADLAIPEASLGVLGSLVRCGAFPACVVALLADRIGRRRVLLGTILAYTLCTGATACAPTVETFVLLQFGARTFAVAETLLAVVVIAEEFDPEVRGWGIGAVGAIQACGAGFAALLFMGVEVLPFGWRGLYLVGLGPLLLLAAWRRTLPETVPFAARQALRAPAPPALQPLRELVQRYPGRLGLVVATVFVLELAEAPAGFFGPKYLQEVHGWTPATIGLLTIMGGALAIVGNIVAGWGSDRWGRRRVALVFILGQVGWTLAYYSVSGPLLVVAWIGRIFTALGANVTLSAFGVELFPTSSRSTAAGLRLLFLTLGGSLGLLLEALLYSLVASHWVAIGMLALLACPGALLVARYFPETAGRPLDDIAPERT